MARLTRECLLGATQDFMESFFFFFAVLFIFGLNMIENPINGEIGFILIKQNPARKAKIVLLFSIK